MEACTKLILSDQVKAILDASESQKQQSGIWSVCLNTITVEKCFNIDDMKKGQQFKHWILPVKNTEENAVLTLA